MSNQTVKSSGIGLCGATFLVFLVMRLTDHIDWAWYWIAAPLWVPIGIAFGAVVLFFVCIGIAMPFAWLIDRLSARRQLALRERVGAARADRESAQHPRREA